MKAYFINRYGKSDVLTSGDRPEPALRDDDVLVQIHAAGVNRDNFLIKKTPEECDAVLGPKVAGLVHLDEASKALPLEFFICFSSLAGVLGHIGQADYAAANAFMDAFAQQRAAKVPDDQTNRHPNASVGKRLESDWSDPRFRDRPLPLPIIADGLPASDETAFLASGPTHIRIEPCEKSGNVARVERLIE